MNLGVKGREATAALRWAGIKDLSVLDIADDSQLLARNDTDHKDLETMQETLVTAIIRMHQHCLAGVMSRVD